MATPERGHPAGLLPGLVLGTLEAEQVAGVETHLALCTECAARVAELRGFAEQVRAAQKRRRSPGAIAGWASAVVAVIALMMITGGFAGYAFRDANPSATEREAARQGDLLEAFARGDVLSSSVIAGDVSVTFFRAPGKGVGFARVSGMPSLPTGKAYKAWVTKDGASFEAGTFTTSHGGVWLSAPGDLGGYQALVFTIEDREARQPAQAPFAVIQLQ